MIEKIKVRHIYKIILTTKHDHENIEPFGASFRR